MEARIVQLPTSEVRVDGERIVIERLVVRDPALAAIVAEREPEDRPAFVERALRIGLSALQDATVTIDVDVVRDEFEKLLRSSEQANAKAAEALDQVLRSNFADGDGRLPRTLEKFLGDRGALRTFVAELFDETKRDSAIGRMRTLLGAYFDGDASKLAMLLDPTRQNSPMYQFRAEVASGFERLHERLTAIERGQEQRDRFMEDIRRFTTEVVDYFRNLTAEEVRAQRAEIGPCPNGDGIIRENRAAYGCSSWQSKEEPGCGFVIWKQQKGRGISPGEARDLLEHGQTELLDGFKTRPNRARLVLAEGNKVQLIAEDGTRLDAPAGPRETIATCPKCGQEIRENSRAYGCSSWKSRKDPGCGFVIWKSTKGRQITVDEARQVIESGVSEWMDFKDRKGSFRGRLVLQPDHTVAVQREDEPAETAPQAA
jgi:ssDNA-binding Zn-finger/Zn-ribbon topoisomerase 1